jgi:hypothetical protein
MRRIIILPVIFVIIFQEDNAQDYIPGLEFSGTDS